MKFERLELPPIEEDRDESRERQLGLIEPERRPERGPEAGVPEEEALGEEAPEEDEET